MIDYAGFRDYLSKLGFGKTTIDNYANYIRANQITILSQIERYQSLNDEEKILKFSNEPANFKDTFDQYHTFAKESTFRDLRSGATNYKAFLQYQALLKTMKKYDSDITLFDLNNAYTFYKVFNDKSYPVKVICRENIAILELQKDFTTNQAKEILKKVFDQKNMKNIQFFDIRNPKEVTMTIALPKNIILYGPPGVGKTYSHKKLISILENGGSLDELESSDYKTDSFESVKSEGRYQFLTFHQNYSYEDFVEGFRPNEEGNIQLESGIFRDISKVAKTNQEASSTKEIKKDFRELFRALIIDQVVEGERLTVQMKRSRFHITEVTDKSILFDKDTGESKHSLSINTLRKMYDNGRNNHIIGGLQPYYDGLLDYLSENSKEIRTDELKNYYLIIDEINRGNISKIFGELITLLEEDKRLGEPNELMVTLPYSKEPFGVPKNLYIIGTMNTADKSIALVDIALRRRFTFVRMEPIDDYLPENIKKINEIIKNRRGADYLIGHAYFMGSQEHDFIMKYKIRPLLEEYFYGEDIDSIFGELVEG